MKNEGIIRSNAKIKAAIKGAQLWLEIQEKEPGGFSQIDLEACRRAAARQPLQDHQNRFPPKTTMSEDWRRN